MSVNRIQKLLFSEYCEFEDMVLVESPFAQTTREGQGLRQVHLGLTPTKLVLATDVLPIATDSSVKYLRGVDPDVETFELVAVYPIQCVCLSIFHRKKKQTLKARFTNNKVLYFELGGFEKRNMFWNLWCERVKLLSPSSPGSSHSETSVATSTTNSTLYLQSSRHVFNKNGTSQLWFQFGVKGNSPKWTDRTLFAGDEDGLFYVPKVSHPKTSDFIIASERTRKCAITPPHKDNSNSRINRFGSDVSENCNSALFLPAENYIVSKKFSQSTTKSADVFTLYPALPLKNSITQFTFPDIAENCVRLWEYYKEASNEQIKHKRRYGLAPQPHFLHGLGPWNVTPGERYSIQIKRTLSMVYIRRQPLEPELRLPVSKRQLVTSISCEGLNLNDRLTNSTSPIKAAPKSPVIFFWTPDYWYRPRSAKDAYLELQNHLGNIREYREDRDKRKGRHGIFRKRRKKYRRYQESDSEEDSSDNMKGNRHGQTKNFLHVFSKEDSYKKDTKSKQDTSAIASSSLQYLKKILKITVSLTAWDFDSTTLAYQLTVIDRDLFLKIPPIELGVLLWQQSSKNAPNVGALIAFSHRISCLVMTEILRDDSEKIRARLVARFINTAEKCNRISNFQSCKSVLSGLQSPSVYRLQTTWSYVRKRHATKYLIFEQLCRQYRDPRLQVYQKAFQEASQTIPYLPFIGDLISRLLDRIPNYKEAPSSKLTSNMIQIDHCRKTPIIENSEKESMSILKKIIYSFKKHHQQQNSHQSSEEVNIEKTSSKMFGTTATKYTSLTDYYKPLNCYEDNRIGNLKDAIELLEKYQRAAAHYCISKNELAREYLLKARYREERENFINSLKIEPNDDANYSFK